jgi:hypothetical protein
LSGIDCHWNVWKECWKQRRLYFIAGIIALIGSSIVSFSIPSVYHAYKQISIDANKDNILEKGDKSELIKKRLGLETSTVTTDPDIYALILRSPAFLSALEKVTLRTSGGQYGTTYAQHISTANQPWWNSFTHKKDILEIIQDNIKCEVNWHNKVITLRVADQDAFIAFQMVDTVSQHLQTELIKYIKSKATVDLKNRRQERDSAKIRYEKAQQKYTTYSERHFDHQAPSYKIEQESLERDASAALREYNDALLQYNITKMNYDKLRPNFIDLKTNLLPLNPSRPHWIANFFLWLFYGWLFTTWFILFRKQYQVKKCQHGER